MKVMNWDFIEAIEQGGEKLPAGGYVVRIVEVEDVPNKEYIWVVYDVAEGEHAGHYSDDFAKKNPYMHRFSRSYKESAQGFFKAFLEALQTSNPGKFDWKAWQQTSNEQDFVGLEIGIVVQNEQYTNDKGEDKERLNVVGIYPAQDIRNGDFKLPPVKDSRNSVEPKSPAAASPSVGYGSSEDVPF